MTISPEAKEAREFLALLFYPPDKPHKFEERAEQSIQLAINSATDGNATANRLLFDRNLELQKEVDGLKKEIECLKIEVEKAWDESRQSVGCWGECDAITNSSQWDYSRAKRAIEGKR